MSKEMEKEITATNKSDMKKRYQMYADAASKLAKKVESKKKGERM
ncbi:hypothetical protein ACTNBM_03980 [Lachnospiraceae bacterium HCP1S3_C3]|nr:hypothetical protein [Lachnospiraceae bacterium]MDY4119339.1 hypothetical protein [Lachnospiraceae bacterium]